VDDELVPEEPEAGERRLNIHLEPADIAGSYANFANISFSRYEFTLTSPGSSTRSKRATSPGPSSPGSTRPPGSSRS
jgi:hypothetical protein